VNLTWKEIGKKPVGISRTEFQYFVLPMVDNNYKFIAEEIIASRKKFGFSFNENYLVDFTLRQLNNNKRSKNIKETSEAYTDNVIRHFCLTNLILIYSRENEQFVDISEGSAQVVKEIFSKFKLE